MTKLDFKAVLKQHHTVRLHQTAQDWKQAIQLCIHPLIAAKLVQPAYFDDILKSVAQYGPYFIIAENVAMPHAQNNSTVQQNCFSLVTLKEPVYFDNDPRPVRLLIGLAATSAAIHTTEALPQIAALVEDTQVVKDLLDCCDETSLFAVIDRVNLHKYLT
ncbi:PTS sugar transporter subunit IIA [Mycoplasmoides pneumoniae]|uniref:PTS sugar transporter subunit IIA n=1 Tax=Mycoplasmoides pneumoniae TaxID=2104 RepID=UPI0035BC8FBB